MLSGEEKKRFIDKSKGLHREISESKTKLNSINGQKEEWFKKKEELKNHIREFIKKIKEIKEQEDKSYENIKLLKEERDKYNSEVKNLISKIKQLKNEKASAFKKYKLKIDPTHIQNKIEEIEKRLETEVSFENEKRLRKEVNKLKKAHEESREIVNIAENITKLSNEIKESKKKADEFHKQIIENSKQKQTHYTEFIALSRKVGDLRKEEEAAFQKFMEFKKQFSDVNAVLKNKLIELSKVNESLGKSDKELKEKKEETLKERIVERTKEVWDKFMSKKKLTTEDLIVLQGKEKE